MKKKVIGVIAFAGIWASGFSQQLAKQIINEYAIKNWTSLGRHATISNDGNFFSYNINGPAEQTLIIRMTEGSWQFEIKGKRFVHIIFSENSKKFMCLYSDTLLILDLQSKRAKKIENVTSVESPNDNVGRWVAFKRREPTSTLTLLDLVSEKEKHYEGVTSFSFDGKGTMLLLQKESRVLGDKQTSMQLIDISNEISKTIWANSVNETILGTPKFDKDGKQIIFITSNASKEKTLWYYSDRLHTAEKKIDKTSRGIDSSLILDGSPSFSENGRWIFFKLIRAPEQRPASVDAVKVNVWSYDDILVQPEQMRQVRRQGHALISFTGVIAVNESRAKILNHEYENVFTSQVYGDHVITMSSRIEPWFTFATVPACYLVSLSDGSRLLLKKQDSDLCNFSFSPNGRWLVYYDKKLRNYFSLNIVTGKAINISKSIPANFMNEFKSDLIYTDAVGVAGWISDDESVLVYDNYDLWQLDPSGIVPGKNITNGYGKKHNLKLRLVDGKISRGVADLVCINGAQLLATAFSPKNKQNGFFKLTVGKVKDPELLFLGSYQFYRIHSQTESSENFDDGMKPLKALQADKWVVKRQTASEAPAYYYTKDFKKFIKLSDLEPHKSYNWLTSELITWKMSDGQISQGVLYKPENFDPKRKYPVLFNYYEQLSQRLYEFPEPDFLNMNINIPWFVSRGYLVFTPDIHYKLASKSGKTTGEWAFNSLVSVANFVSKLPYVDVKKMAIQGHSFGSKQTNYIVTRTDIFTAAASFAGTSDDLSAYLTLAPAFNSIPHFDKQANYEFGQGRFGATPWEKPVFYINNSAVINAHKVRTPILIMHNEKDNSIPWGQGMEWYMALRRLGKESWLLQYDEGGHGVQGKDAIDLTIRTTQFFDHYLKNAPAPVWMSRGIPARLKGIETGYAYDPSGNCGKDCKVCKQWNDKYKKDSAACWNEIERRKVEEHWQ